jgi:hypothetical protein
LRDADSRHRVMATAKIGPRNVAATIAPVSEVTTAPYSYILKTLVRRE